MERVPFLVATSEPLMGRRYPITADGLVLGRENECDVVIPGEGVSRQHARVIWHNGAVWVQDSGSRNGAFVNGKRVQRHKQMGPGDELVVGEQHFSVEVVQLPEDPTESLPATQAIDIEGPPPPSSMLPIAVPMALVGIALLVLALLMVVG